MDFERSIARTAPGGTMHRAAGVVMAALTLATTVAAQDGFYDSGWAGGGRVQVETVHAQTRYAGHLMIQTDGKLLIAGECTHPAGWTFCASRRHADGSADTGFGSNGSRIYETLPNASLRGIGQAAGGKILLAGTTQTGVPIVARLTAAGALDVSLGQGDGYFAFPFVVPNGVPPNGSLEAMTVLADGKVLVAGTAETWRGNKENYDVAVARLLPDLSGLDPTFGDAGVRTVAFDLAGIGAGFGDNNDGAWAMAIHPNGRIIVAGQARYNPSGSMASGWTRAVVARMTAQGNLDTGFGSGGKVVYTSVTASTPSFRAVALDRSGHVVTAGSIENAGSIDFWVTRLLGHGQGLDLSFGTNGQTTIAFHTAGNFGDEALALALQSDGRVLVAGLVGRTPASHYFGVARLTRQGIPDPSFGFNGRAYGTFAPAPSGGSSDWGVDLAIGNGGLMVAGTGNDPAGTAVRYGLAKLQLDLVFTDGFQP